MRQTVQRVADWFEPWSGRVSPTREPPRPRVLGVREDGEGLLWVLIWIADDEFEPLPRPGRNINEPQSSDSRAYDMIIEVLDPGRGTLVASQRFDYTLSGFLPSGELVRKDLSPGGFQVLRIVRPRLTGG